LYDLNFSFLDTNWVDKNPFLFFYSGDEA